MSCTRCGRRSKGRLCEPCGQDERWGGFGANSQPITFDFDEEEDVDDE